jgi:hypothetical protein
MLGAQVDPAWACDPRDSPCYISACFGVDGAGGRTRTDMDSRSAGF